MYGYKVYSFEDSDKPFIVITHDDEFMPVTAWNEFDLALFRFYLDDKHKDLPIYMDFGSNVFQQGSRRHLRREKLLMKSKRQHR
ncbi:hypothetical protein, partial [Listeria booriae]